MGAIVLHSLANPLQIPLRLLVRPEMALNVGPLLMLSHSTQLFSAHSDAGPYDGGGSPIPVEAHAAAQSVLLWLESCAQTWAQAEVNPVSS